MTTSAATSKREKLLPEARALGAEGVGAREIAAALGVHPATVRRWAKQDAAAGSPWRCSPAPSARPQPEHRQAEAAPGRRMGSAERMCTKLEDRLEALVDKAEADPEDSRLEERMVRLCRVIESLRTAQGDDPAAALETMKRFAGFCVRRLTEDEMPPVRKAVRLFLDELKKEHT